MEAAAEQAAGYHPLILPPLLQTEAYARAALLATAPPGSDLNRLVEARLHPQRLLARSDPPPPQLRFLVDEAALHRAGHGKVMAEQLDHLATLAEHPRLDLKIVPFAGGLHPAIPARAFTIINLDDDSHLFAADGPGFAACHQPGALAEHQRMLSAADAVAIPGSGTGIWRQSSTTTPVAGRKP